MRILFSALHLAYFRNFESAIREMAARGHQVHLAADEPERFGGQGLADRLAAEYPGVSSGFLPSLEEEPWHLAASSLRVSLDYVRVLAPGYPSKLRLRAAARTARAVRWAADLPVAGRPLTFRALKAIERLMPPSQLLIDYLRREAPDVVVLASLTYSRSQQLDLLKAARALGIPVAAAIMSWDHLSSKALLHIAPDMMLVWNDVQRREAIEMHGIPADRVAVTGAQCYDQWFGRRPARTREAFCAAMGLRADRPFVLWVHSALSPTPQPPEPVLVDRWLTALRASGDARLRELGVLVRPHPERVKEWAGIDLSRFDNVAFNGRNPIDAAAKDDYFDALYYSSAVIGLVTSAFLEAAVVGRPVLTFTLPEYRMHQEEMVHFQYLTGVGGGLLHVASDVEGNLHQLAGVIAVDGAREERNERFLHAFVRPAGLDRPATPAFVDALERLHREVPRGATRALAPESLVRLTARVAAGVGRTEAGRWLLNDARDDHVDEHRTHLERARRLKDEKKRAHQEAKLRRRARRQRRDALKRRGKEVKHWLRHVRHRAVVAIYRAMVLARLSRPSLPGQEDK